MGSRSVIESLPFICAEDTVSFIMCAGDRTSDAGLMVSKRFRLAMFKQCFRII